MRTGAVRLRPPGAAPRAKTDTPDQLLNYSRLHPTRQLDHPKALIPQAFANQHACRSSSRFAKREASLSQERDALSGSSLSMRAVRETDYSCCRCQHSRKVYDIRHLRSSPAGRCVVGPFNCRLHVACRSLIGAFEVMSGCTPLGRRRQCRSPRNRAGINGGTRAPRSPARCPAAAHMIVIPELSSNRELLTNGERCLQQGQLPSAPPVLIRHKRHRTKTARITRL